MPARRCSLQQRGHAARVVRTARPRCSTFVSATAAAVALPDEADVVVVGAGLAGLNAAATLHKVRACVVVPGQATLTSWHSALRVAVV
jgi:NADPH-dependent 2,4-dienoyl-CoA reductase/sulfur reductase-like enzyme